MMSESTVPSLLDRLANVFRVSFAAYVACAVGLGLLALTLMSWMMFRAEPQRVAWGDYLQWPQLAMLGALWLVICAVTYWTVRFWMEDVPARERELDKSWRAGLKAITKRGIQFQELPVFLVLGCTDEQKQCQFVKHSRLKLCMEPFPCNQESPIRWFIADDRILLFCGEVGTLGQTQSRLPMHRSLNEHANMQEALVSNRWNARTSARNVNVAQPEDEHIAGPAYFGRSSTITSSSSNRSSSSVGWTTDDHSDASADSIATLSYNLPAPNAAAIPSTTEAMESLEHAERLLESWHEQSNIPEASITHRANTIRQHTRLLSSTEVVRGQNLLEDLCRLIQIERAGVAPVNGIIAWVDAQPLMDCVGFADQCGQSLHRDQCQIQEQFGLLAPTTIVFDRMQEVGGFTELVRRSGPEKATQGMLGEIADVTEVPDQQTIHHLCQRAMGSIQSAIYQNLRPRSTHQQPANHKLFQLLLHSRSKLHEALETFLLHAFAHDRSAKPELDPNVLSGVFFTASGESPTEQAFGKTVMDRMLADQELLCWTSRQQKFNAKCNGIAWNLKVACALLVLAIILQLFFKFIR